MWRLSLSRRLSLLLVAISVAIGWSFLKIGPEPADGYERVEVEGDLDDPAIVNNVNRLLLERFGLIPLGKQIITWEEPDLVSVGLSGALWVSAQLPDEEFSDLYRMDFKVSRLGIPISTSVPVNFTQTLKGQEELLDVNGGRVLYALRSGGSIDRIVHLDFVEGFSSDTVLGQGLEALNARRRYGRWTTPRRTDFVLSQPVTIGIQGHLQPDGFSIRGDGLSMSANVRTGVADPNVLGVFVKDQYIDRQPRDIIMDMARESPIFGQERVIELSAFGHTLRENLSGILEWGSADREVTGAKSRLKMASTAAVLWPPSPLEIEGESHFPNEGVWVPPGPFKSAADPVVLSTRIQFDPTRAEGYAHLTAFDMRRLGFGYVAGTAEPRSESGMRGDGRIPEARRRNVVGVFNAGLGMGLSKGGQIHRNRILVSPTPGLATVAIAGDGKPGFGLWDAESLHPPWVSLVQSLPPLVERGAVKLTVGRRWGQQIASYDGQALHRSALAVTETGVLLYAWSPSITAYELADVLRRSGGDFAMHLDLGAEGNGVEYFSKGLDSVEREFGDSAMALHDRTWDQTSGTPFFYVYGTGVLSRFIERSTQRSRDPIDWSIVQLIDDVPAVAIGTTDISGAQGKSQVKFHLLSADRLRPHFVPGIAEPRAPEVDGREELVLPTAPLLAVGVGLRAPTSAYGLTIERRVWKRPQAGIMTLVSDTDGVISIGRFGPGGIDPTIRWSGLVQGPSLLSDGQLGDGATGVSGTPVVAAGLSQEGLLVLATSEDGDRVALAEGMRRLNIENALILGMVGTADTGLGRFFFETDGTLLMMTEEAPELRPAETEPGASSALYFTARTSRPAARILSTFSTN